MQVSRWHLLALTCIFLPRLLWADFQNGQAAYQRGDYQTAREIWLPLAEQGDANAQLKLGQIYRLGEGVPRDYRIAAHWFAKAAHQGMSEARRNLDLMVRDGSITAADATEAEAADTISATRPPLPSVVEDISITAPLVLIAKSSAEKPRSQATAVQTISPNWLQGLDPQAYVVQLIALSQAQAVDDLLARFQAELPAAGTTRINSKGQQWHVLLLGPYADKAQAERAYAALPTELKQGKPEPWIRRVEAVQAVAF